MHGRSGDHALGDFIAESRIWGKVAGARGSAANVRGVGLDGDHQVGSRTW